VDLEDACLWLSSATPHNFFRELFILACKLKLFVLFLYFFVKWNQLNCGWHSLEWATRRRRSNIHPHLNSRSDHLFLQPLLLLMPTTHTTYHYYYYYGNPKPKSKTNPSFNVECRQWRGQQTSSSKHYQHDKGRHIKHVSWLVSEGDNKVSEGTLSCTHKGNPKLEGDSIKERVHDLN